MNNRSRTTDSDPHLSAPLDDGDSHVRERAPSAPAVTRESTPRFSLDERLASKLAKATELLAKLEPQDARARLLHIAVLRRDEALLDGILAELALPARATPRSR